MKIGKRDYKVTPAGWVVLVIFIFVAAYFVSLLMRKTPGSCFEFAQAGMVNINKNNGAYNPALDNDKDGVACELR